MNRVYVCIDLKTFFASVECVERKLDPFKTDLVVADPSRGDGAICLAISPKMKLRGIKNRCRMWEIPKNIHPIIAKPRMKKYRDYSIYINTIYLDYVNEEDWFAYSIDECFIDATPYLNYYKKTPKEFAKMLIDAVYKKTGITAAAGIGTNMYLAKIALDITAKHSKDNIGYLDENLYKEQLWHHTPLTDFWQIGRGIERRLFNLHLKDMFDISKCEESLLYKEFGINAEILIDHSKGIEPCTIKDVKEYKPKSNSISNTHVLDKDYNFEDARNILIEMVDNLILDLVSRKKYASTVSLYIGYTKDKIPPMKFTVKLEQATSSYTIILNKILSEYDFRVNQFILIRRIGIFFGNLKEKLIEQLDLFSIHEISEKDLRIEMAMNEIKNKYGKNSILRGLSFTENATQIKRNKLLGGHNAE
ncbi:MAG: DNA repair protein [Bacilli bacterium]|nr:DNA repair protein [Bacilli bacterium]